LPLLWRVDDFHEEFDFVAFLVHERDPGQWGAIASGGHRLALPIIAADRHSGEKRPENDVRISDPPNGADPVSPCHELQAERSSGVKAATFASRRFRAISANKSRPIRSGPIIRTKSRYVSSPRMR